MKFTLASSLALLAAVAQASPMPQVSKRELGTRTIAKRATVTDACDIGFASGTTGGNGGTTTTVSSLAQYTEAAEADGPAVILLDGQLSGSYRVRVKSDKTIIGLPGSSLDGIGHYINKQNNVIMRNLKITNVLADNGDAIGIQESENVWVDHCDLSSTLSGGKDDHDGLLDITRAADFITVSNTFLHDHFKASLIGHSDSNAGQDTGKFHVTYIDNHWQNTNSRNPSIRFGTVHIVNNVFDNIGATGVNCRMGAQVLLESSSFSGASNPVVFRDSPDTGFIVTDDVAGLGDHDVPQGTLTSVPYSYEKRGSGSLSGVVSSAGQTLSFDGSSAPAPAPAPEQPVEEAPVEQPVEESPEEEFEEVCTRRRVRKSLRV